MLSILTRCFRAVALWFVIGIIVSAEVLAHHGRVNNPALYLPENLVELEGDITDVLWRNPHIRLRLKVVSDTADETIWELELGGSIISFKRMGIASSFIQAGDRVKAAGYISKRDSHSLGVVNLLLPNGQEFVNGDRELRWSSIRMADAIQPIDPARVESAETAASGIFRVWGRQRHPPFSSYEHLLTDRARELAVAFDPVRDDPELECRQGMPTAMFDPTPMQIDDDGDRVIIRIQEYDVERIIYLNVEGRSAPPVASPLGYSLGRWEGDTLVVTTTHVDWPRFNPWGTPQSAQVGYTERFSVNDDGRQLNYFLTVTDPIMFIEPFTLQTARQWTPGVEIEPYNCAPHWENSTG